MSKTQIGWYVLKEDKIFRNTYETAAWYEDVLVKAGKYPMEVYDFRLVNRKDGVRVEGYIGGVYVSMPGTVTSDYFASLFFGVPVSDYDIHKNAGKNSDHTMFNYMYNVSESVLNGEGVYELLPEYEAREIRFEYDGEEHVTHGIFRKEVVA